MAGLIGNIAISAQLELELGLSLATTLMGFDAMSIHRYSTCEKNYPTGTVPVNKNYRTGTVPVSKNYPTGTLINKITIFSFMIAL